MKRIVLFLLFAVSSMRATFIPMSGSSFSRSFIRKLKEQSKDAVKALEKYKASKERREITSGTPQKLEKDINQERDEKE